MSIRTATDKRAVERHGATRFASYALIAALVILGSALAPAAHADQVSLDADLTWHAGGVACSSCSIELVVSMIFDNATGAISPGTLSEQVIASAGTESMVPLTIFQPPALPGHCSFGASNGLGDALIIDFYESLGLCQRPIQPGDYTLMAAYMDCFSQACRDVLGGPGGFQRPSEGFISVREVAEPSEILLLLASGLPVFVFTKRRRPGKQDRPGPGDC